MRWVLALAVALMPVLNGVQARADAPLRITLDQARAAAGNALQARRPADALTLAEGVLMGAPGDLAALFIKAQAQRDLGNRQAALETARAAWAASDGAQEKYHAAMLMAQMRSFAGSNTLAQLWLRRAAEIAPDPRMKAAAIQDFRQVRRMTPWRIGLDLFAEPSDNLNNAPTRDTSVPTGVVSVTRPLSGLRYGGAVRLRYTKPLNPRARLHFSGFGRASAVRLSQEARQQRGADAGALGQTMLGGALGWEAMSAAGTQLTRSDLTLLRQWQGGQPIANIARLDLSVERALDWAPGLRIGGRLGLEDVRRLDAPIGDAQRREVDLTVSRTLGPGALSLGLGLGQTFSRAASVGRRDGDLSLRYGLAHPVSGMLPSLTLHYGVYNYDAPWVGTPTGAARRDRARSLGIDVVLPGLDHYGFAPELGLSFTDRNSNYNLYENRSTDLRLGLKSVF